MNEYVKKQKELRQAVIDAADASLRHGACWGFAEEDDERVVVAYWRPSPHTGLVTERTMALLRALTNSAEQGTEEVAVSNDERNV